MNFNRKVALVTGAGIGIGYALCEAFAQRGAYVALSDVDGDLARRAADTLNHAIGEERVIPFGVDVADVVALRQKVDAVLDRFGKLDIAVANAGITIAGKFLDYRLEDFDRLMEVNLRGSYFTAQTAARAMVDKGIAGRIVLMSSVTGVKAFDNLGTYGISKAAIQMMARSMAFELGKYGITVNAVAPGATLTERTLKSSPNYAQGWSQVTPNRSVATVEDIAHTVLFLTSDEADHVTGQTIVIDGGWTLYSPLPADE